MNENARILIVEDDEHLLHATSRLLHGAGYKVVETTTGSDGLRLTREKQPDLVLLDVVLPDMDGLEVCRRIKADADLARTYVVLLSAIRTESDNQADGLEAGADGYIVRPISNRELLARVEALLRLRQVEETLRERTHQLDGRVKELNCLYGISQLVEKPAISLDEILQGTVDLLPPAWQYPGITCARIILKDQEFKTDNFQESAWRQACDVQVSGNRAGRVEVFYLQERPERGEGPFLEGERRLLNAVAERLGRIVERMQAEEALRDSEATARVLLNTPTDVAALLDAQGVMLDANETMARRFGRSVDELVGLSAWDLFPPQLAERRKAYVDQVIQSGRPVRFEDEREGTWFDNAVYPVLDARGQVSRIAVLARDVTERKQAEEALRAEKEFSETVLDTVMDSLFVFDPNTGEPIRWNKAFNKLSGCTDEEIASKKAPDDWYSEEDLAKTKAETEKLFRGEKSIVVMSLIAKDGRRIPTEYTASLIRDPEGKPKYIVAVGRDITERRQAQEVLRQSVRELGIRNQINSIFLTYPDEEMYAEFLKLILAMMSSEYGTFGYFDEHGSFVAPALTRQIYWERCNVPEKDIIFQKGTFGGIWGRAIEERKTLTANEGPFNVPQGHIPIKNTMVTPIIFRDEVISAIHLANKPNGYDEQDVATVEMIAAQIAPVLYARVQHDRREKERKQAEEALRESEEQYRDLVENISDVIYAVDTDGVVTYVSPAVESLFGHHPSEVVGRPFAQFMAPEDAKQVGSSFQKLAAGESPGPNEYRVTTKAGEVRWIRASSQPVVEGDQVTVVRGVLTDITDHKRAEEQLEEAAAAAERERLARELHDAVTQVLFSASLIADALPRVWERHPEEGLRGVEEIRRLTHGALAEMRMLLLELRPAALREQELGVLLRQLADAMMARTRMPVTTTVVGECTPPTEVKISLYRIAQEALNNVAKHAQASRATLSLRCEPSGATLRISDNGRGFDPDTVQPHHLGVAIMHERAQAIGATLNIESQPGQGTEITATWSSGSETDGE